MPKIPIGILLKFGVNAVKNHYPMQRIRERHIRQSTAVYNQMRGLLSEYGVAVERSISKIARAIS